VKIGEPAQVVSGSGRAWSIVGSPEFDAPVTHCYAGQDDFIPSLLDPRVEKFIVRSMLEAPPDPTSLGRSWQPLPPSAALRVESDEGRPSQKLYVDEYRYEVRLSADAVDCGEWLIAQFNAATGKVKAESVLKAFKAFDPADSERRMVLNRASLTVS